MRQALTLCGLSTASTLQDVHDGYAADCESEVESQRNSAEAAEAGLVEYVLSPQEDEALPRPRGGMDVDPAGAEQIAAI